MGTANFKRLENVSKYYVLECIDEFDYQINFDSILFDLDQRFNLYDSPQWIEDSSKSFGYFYYETEICGVYVRLIFTPYISSGYYSGASLDYKKDFTIFDSDGIEDERISFETFMDAYEYSAIEIPENRLKLVHRAVIGYISSISDQVNKELEKLYSEHSSVELNLVGIFSNGEAIYKEIN